LAVLLWQPDCRAAGHGTARLNFSDCVYRPRSHYERDAVHELSSEFPNTHHVTIGEGSALLAAFEQAVLLHHARPALGAGRWQPTYGELNAAANRLAHALLGRSGTSEDPVAILMQRANRSRCVTARE
jgi:non-ribosomal peptide synthetase component F